MANTCTLQRLYTGADPSEEDELRSIALLPVISHERIHYLVVGEFGDSLIVPTDVRRMLHARKTITYPPLPLPQDWIFCCPGT